VDDVLDCLLEASDRYTDPFDHPLLGWLRELHESFGVRVDLYLFWQGKVGGRLRTLAEVSSCFRRHFERADWLRFGPHARDYDLAPYSQAPEDQQATFDDIYNEIERFAGHDRTTRWNRLHYFSECYELASYFRQRGSDVLLLTDKLAGAYRLPEAQRHRLIGAGRLSLGNMHLLQSHYRMEFFERDGRSEDDIATLLRGTLRRRGYVSLFTHEVDFARPTLRAIVETSLRCAASVALPADVRPVTQAPALPLVPPMPASRSSPVSARATGIRG
jgi:hypothetical protein